MYTDIKGIEEEIENRNKLNEILYSPSSRPKQRLTSWEEWEHDRGSLSAVYDGKIDEPFKTKEVKT